MAKVFLVELSKARTVALERLVAMFSPLNLLQFESLPNCVLHVCQTRKQNNESGKFREFCGGRHCFRYCSWPPV